MDSKIRFKKEIYNNKELCEFLIENNAFNNFMKNGIDYIKKYEIKDGEVITMVRRTSNPIIRAFDWNKTPEGTDYWCNLYNKYKKYQITN